jgi:catechol 2,3-dioxygenase-like lactoylglutathione lyase family enzyme
MKYMVSIDVPAMAAGLEFYRDALGFQEVARPIDSYVILQCGDGRIGLMEKASGSKPAEGSDDVRRYGRHWTPVHIDFHVDNFDDFLARAVEAGAKCEKRFDVEGRPPIAFCSDPFGHGFCVLGSSA